MKTKNLRTLTRFGTVFGLSIATGFTIVGIPTALSVENPLPVYYSNPGTGDYRPMTRDRQSTSARRDSRYRDREIAQDIKETLSQEPALSTGARNVQVSTQRGNVMLKGTVASEAEKLKVETIARERSATGLVENDLTVKTE
jgi:hypothetical protein